MTIGCFANKQMDKNDIKVSRKNVIRNTSEGMKGRGRNMDNLENSEEELLEDFEWKLASYRGHGPKKKERTQPPQILSLFSPENVQLMQY